MYSVKIKYTPQFLLEMNKESLELLLHEAKQKLLELKTDRAQRFGFAERPHLFKKVRKDIARIMTVLNFQ